MITDKMYQELAQAVLNQFGQDTTEVNVDVEGKDYYMELTAQTEGEYIDESFSHEFGIEECGYYEPQYLSACNYDFTLTRVDEDEEEIPNLEDDDFNIEKLNEYIEHPKMIQAA